MPNGDLATEVLIDPGTGTVQVELDPAMMWNTTYGLHTMRDGQVARMLSVNAATGVVWYHNWHGDFIAMQDHDTE